jgi:hypothetical protein
LPKSWKEELEREYSELKRRASLDTAKLINITPKYAYWLETVGILTREDLAAVGPVNAYIRVREAHVCTPEYCHCPDKRFLYSLTGAMRGVTWRLIDMAEHRKVEAQVVEKTGRFP